MAAHAIRRFLSRPARVVGWSWAVLCGWQREPVAIGVAATVVSVAILPQPAGLFAAGLAILGLVVVITDLQRMIIPDWANLGIFIFGIALAALEADVTQRAAVLGDAVLRSTVACASLYLLRLLYWRIARQTGLGLGDVKLAAAGAPWLTWTALPVALELAALSALAAIAMRAVRQGAWPDRHHALPFGAFLAPAIWLTFLAERTAGIGG
jgi:leader peptidase (prepilin peptidase)/N-methyltransferase